MGKHRNKNKKNDKHHSHIKTNGKIHKHTNDARHRYSPPTTSPSAFGIKKNNKKSGGILEQLRQHLQGGRFRWLNEQLYTTTSQEAAVLIQKDPSLYNQYHQGFREQTRYWPQQPINSAINWLKSKPNSWIVADLGCGDAALAKAAKQKVHSFDLVAHSPDVVACNIANLPLPHMSVDAGLFCLALMGTDYGRFIEEADRVLKKGGRLWIAEVRSRFEGRDSNGEGSDEDEDEKDNILDRFVSVVKAMGYIEVSRKMDNSHFIILEFEKKREEEGGEEGKKKRRKKKRWSWPELRPCIYKKR
jgi:ribosomal RNA-processing protein 8